MLINLQTFIHKETKEIGENTVQRCNVLAAAGPLVTEPGAGSRASWNWSRLYVIVGTVQLSEPKCASMLVQYSY